MLNRFQRTASKHAYYGYITRHNPEHLRRYQSERNYSLGRKGAFDTLVWKMAADHISYEQDFNLRYKTPPLITNLSMRITMFWFWVPALLMSVFLGDMVKLFTPHIYLYAGQPGENAESPTRYQTLYFHDRPVKF